MSIPESHVVAEGRSLKLAIEAAAAQLGVPTNVIGHKLDMAHFRAAGSTGAETVKIFAWAKDAGDVAAVNDAVAWMNGLLKSMGRQGSVRADRREATVMTFVDVGEEGRHLVGRGGSTLRAVQYLMEAAVGVKHPGIQFRIDVARPEGDARGEDRPRDRDDRPRQDDRGPRRDDRGPRRDDRGPRRDDRGPRRDDRGGNSEQRLKELALKLASKVSETGEPEVIRRELNSYERRLVHTEVANVPGVASRSLGEGTEKRVEIYRSDTPNTEA